LQLQSYRVTVTVTFAWGIYSRTVDTYSYSNVNLNRFTMGLGDNLMLSLDQTVTGILGEWDIYTTGMAAAIISFLVYQAMTARDPDAHPMLLSRQAQGSPVRQQKESAVFRSPSAPHGIALNSGLGVKDASDSKWSRGRDGDLRDVWQRVVTGALDREGKPTRVHGEISTVLGTETIVVHDIGKHLPPGTASMLTLVQPISLDRST
jgi:hypothetical protein